MTWLTDWSEFMESHQWLVNIPIKVIEIFITIITIITINSYYIFIQPDSYHQPPATNHQSSFSNHQPSTINHQPPTINHQLPSTKHQFTSSADKALLIHCASGWHRSSQQTSNVGHHGLFLSCFLRETRQQLTVQNHV